jgi:hypothetical protein
MYTVILVLLLIILVYLIQKYNIHEKFTEENLDVAVIVEPREHKYLVPIVLNFIENLPQDTKIQIFHGTHNLNFLIKHLEKEIKSGKIILTNLGKKNIEVKNYSYLLTSVNFWEKVQGENILIFQTDTCLCKSGIHKLKELYQYDYVGAPWKKNFNKKSDNTRIGGNGGLSFRKKSKMLEICRAHKPTYRNEDIFFSSKKLKFPKKKDTTRYFTETLPSDNPIGVHKAWQYLNHNDLKKLKKNCPEMQKIFNK